MGYKKIWLLTTLLVVMAPPVFASDINETTVRSKEWGRDYFFLREESGRGLHLLISSGDFSPCKVSAEQAGGAAILRSPTKIEYGCWWALTHEEDESTWLNVVMNDGTELFRPISDFRKRRYNGSSLLPPSRWSEEAIEDSIVRALEHFRQVNIRIRIIKSLTPSFSEKELSGAEICLLATAQKIEQYTKVVEVMSAEHESYRLKWNDRIISSSSDISEQQDDLAVIVNIGYGLNMRTYTLDQELKKCLDTEKVPFQ